MPEASVQTDNFITATDWKTSETLDKIRRIYHHVRCLTSGKHIPYIQRQRDRDFEAVVYDIRPLLEDYTEIALLIQDSVTTTTVLIGRD
jgi:hypothetical protein